MFWLLHVRAGLWAVISVFKSNLRSYIFMEIFEVGDCQLWVMTALVDGGKTFLGTPTRKEEGTIQPNYNLPQSARV